MRYSVQGILSLSLYTLPIPELAPQGRLSQRWPVSLALHMVSDWPRPRDVHDSSSREFAFSRLALTLAGSHPSACPFLWHACAPVSGACAAISGARAPISGAQAHISGRPACRRLGPQTDPPQSSDKSDCIITPQMNEKYMNDQHELDPAQQSHAVAQNPGAYACPWWVRSPNPTTSRLRNSEANTLE